MKREKRLTKREKKALGGAGAPPPGQAQHIHCVACGRHVDPGDWTASPPRAAWVRCAHNTRFASCSGCVTDARQLLAEHDRTGQPVQAAQAWH